MIIDDGDSLIENTYPISMIVCKTLKCVIMTPLGIPVVPDEGRIQNTSSIGSTVSCLNRSPGSLYSASVDVTLLSGEFPSKNISFENSHSFTLRTLQATICITTPMLMYSNLLILILSH
jgi:hypothetical protein